MTYYTREQWAARDPKPGPGPLAPAEVDGIALHWPAMKTPLTHVEAVKSGLRGWQNYHMDDKGWSDIAYQEAIDQKGNVYGLRGLATQPGANGDRDTNENYGALLLVLAPGEEPSVAMIEAVRRRIAKHREMFPRSTQIVGHNDIRPEGTLCPGLIVQRLLDEGAFNPEPPGPSPRQELRKEITKDIRSAKENRETAKEQGRPRVAKDLTEVIDELREARGRIPKD